MQISRHWRLNGQRYRLQGIRYENGQVSLTARPMREDMPQEYSEDTRTVRSNKNTTKITA